MMKHYPQLNIQVHIQVCNQHPILHWVQKNVLVGVQPLGAHLELVDIYQERFSLTKGIVKVKTGSKWNVRRKCVTLCARRGTTQINQFVSRRVMDAALISVTSVRGINKVDRLVLSMLF